MTDLKNLQLLNRYYSHYELGNEYYGDKTGKVYKLVNSVYRPMSPYKNRDGYMEYVLTNANKVKKHIMGQIICAGLHVSGRTDVKNEVNHKDGVRDNNNAYNLEWTSRSGNILHSYRELRIKTR